MRAASTFALMFAWDWTTTAYTRLAADGSLAAVPVAALLTAQWWLGVQLVARSRVLFLAAVAGAALGTLAGLYVP